MSKIRPCYIKYTRHKGSDDYHNDGDNNTLDNGSFACKGVNGAQPLLAVFPDINTEYGTDCLADTFKE